MTAKYIDFLLFALVGLTTALLAYKALQLFLGTKLFRRLEPAVIAAAPNRSVGDRKEEVSVALERLEGNMALLGTIAAAAPFIGLIGTVLHIMDALSHISGASLDIGLISGPIATALNSTLVGLASAVPAAIAYNLFSRRIQVMDNAARRVFERETDERSES